MSRSLWVPGPCDRLRQIVCDVEHYPEFLPGCRSARILQRRERDGKAEWDAELEVAARGLTWQLRTRNLEVPDGLDMSLLSGPFHHLNGRWRFTPRGEGCQLSLNLEFRPKGMLLRSLLMLFSDPAADRIVRAFRHRAGLPTEQDDPG